MAEPMLQQTSEDERLTFEQFRLECRQMTGEREAFHRYVQPLVDLDGTLCRANWWYWWRQFCQVQDERDLLATERAGGDKGVQA